MSNSLPDSTILFQDDQAKLTTGPSATRPFLPEHKGDDDETTQLSLIANTKRGRFEEQLPSAVAGSSFCVEGVRVVGGMTLVLHGDIDLESTPHLEAVLCGIALLQPIQLVIDLSGVGTVSLDALALFHRYRESVGDLLLRSPNMSTRNNLLSLGGLKLVEQRKVSEQVA